MHEIDRNNLTQRLSEITTLTMVSVAIVAPAIVLSPALPFFKLEQLLIPIIVFVYAWMLLAGVARTIRLNGLFLVGALYCLCNVLSIWYGATSLGHPVVGRDLYELPKVWLPVAFFTIGYECRLTEQSCRRLISAFSIPAILVCIYGWAQFANSGFAYKLNPFYSSGGHIDLALQYARRVYATMGNPNVLGELMVCCSLLFLLAFLNQVGSRLVNLLLAMACVVTLVMTGSRFGLVAAAIGLLIVAFLVSYSGRRNLAKLGLLLAFLPIFVWTYQTVATSNRRTLERYQTLRNPLEIDSLRERIDQLWKDEWRDFTESPIVGHGPAKAVFTLGYTDSEYLEVLRGFGLLGLLLYAGYYAVPIYMISRGLRDAKRNSIQFAAAFPASEVCAQFGLLVGFLALLMNIPMATFYNPFLQGFLWLWLGIGAGVVRRFPSKEQKAEIVREGAILPPASLST